jgi:serine/threonine-protein kinase mTOR
MFVPFCIFLLFLNFLPHFSPQHIKQVSGIEGTFRLTSERVMKVLRTNKDSLLAIFDALAHDPLLLWGPRELDAKDADLEANKSNDIIGLPVEIAAVEESASEGTAATRRTTARRTRKDNASAADKARLIIQRVEDKLAGRDCDPVGGAHTVLCCNRRKFVI